MPKRRVPSFSKKQPLGSSFNANSKSAFAICQFMALVRLIAKEKSLLDSVSISNITIYLRLLEQLSVFTPNSVAPYRNSIQIYSLLDIIKLATDHIFSDMTNEGLNTLATTTPLNDDGESFKVDYLNNN